MQSHDSFMKLSCKVMTLTPESHDSISGQKREKHSQIQHAI